MRSIDRAAISEKRRDVDVLMATAPKHYMRQKVWLPIASKRQQLLGRPISYFTLTTPDLFDVKLLERAGLIERTARGYPGLGFCERSDKVYSDIVRELRWCRLSHKGSFEDMALRNEAFESLFGFDVINLDFTWVPFPEQESPLEGTWGAIKKLLEVQRDKGLSCDLFMTFKGSRHRTDEDSIERIANLLDTNLSSGRGVQQFSQRVGHLDPKRLLSEDYLTFLAVGLPKLFVGEALNLGFHLSRANVYSYQRDGRKAPYHIVKFVFGLEVPGQAQQVFAAMPELVANYDTAITELFERPVVNVGDIIDADPDLSSALQEDLESLKSIA